MHDQAVGVAVEHEHDAATFELGAGVGVMLPMTSDSMTGRVPSQGGRISHGDSYLRGPKFK